MRYITGVVAWRQGERRDALEAIRHQSPRLTWSRRLVLALLEELHTDDDFERIVGDVRRLPPHRYPQVLAVAVALRHSWSPDDFIEISTRLGLFVVQPAAPTAERTPGGSPRRKDKRCAARPSRR